MYIAEAGTGGTGPCTVLPTGLNVCYGTTGNVVEVLGGVQSDYITGLPSLADAAVSEALGAHAGSGLMIPKHPSTITFFAGH